jgi:FdhD protein
MENKVARVPVLRVTEDGRENIEDVVAREFALTIILNNQELVTLLCSPQDLNHLAIGFLFSESLLENRDQIRKVVIDDKRGVVRVETPEDRELSGEVIFKRLITSGCGRGASFYSAADTSQKPKIESRTQISSAEVLSLVNDFQHHSEVYRATGGVHSAALSDPDKILVFNEDIGRHNAIDKIFGECILEGIPTEGRIIITSGRITSEILLKVAKRGIPIIISKSAPTDMSVNLANEMGITIIGFVRGKRLNAYTHNWRIIHHGR